MANRSYLYSLSNRPTSYEDRPETISGISEWAYDVPFIYRLLMSGDPQLCASLVSDGLGDDQAEQRTRLYAISSPFESGFERVKRFAAITKAMLAMCYQPVAAPSQPSPAASLTSSLVVSLKRLFSWGPDSIPVPLPPAPAHFSAWLDEAVAFLETHRDNFLLLETIELDTMSESQEEPLRACVEAEIARCRHVGAAFEALPLDTAEAARVLRGAAGERCPAPLDAFFGLRFDDDCDSTRTRATEHPLGLSNWSEVLYFGLFNRAEFDAHLAVQTPE